MITGTEFLDVGYLSCQPINSFEALEGIQITDQQHKPTTDIIDFHLPTKS